MEIKFYIERENKDCGPDEDRWNELELIVSATYSSGRPARLGSYEYSSPAEPEEIEYTITSDGKPFDESSLTENEVERLLDTLRDEAHNEYECALEARAEERATDYDY